MRVPTKKSRKLAWVVLGVVVLALIAGFIQLSFVYTRWRPSEVGIGLGYGIHFYKSRKQVLPWLPGRDCIDEEITEDEWDALHRKWNRLRRER